MKAAVALLALIALSAAAEPFPRGDPKIGKALADKSCVACHVRLVGGDGSDIYQEPLRKIQTSKQLLARVATCNVQANAGWFPEEEEHVAAYLNQKYYRFKN